MTALAAAPRPSWEVADAIRRHGEAFLQTHGGSLSGVHKQTLRDLARCRTATLGGHVTHCLDCGCDRIAYNSCRNRHCPKCQALTRARWLAKEAANLLPVEYFHVVFTLPAEVAEVALANRTTLYELLFQAASATLRDVAANPKRLRAQVGVLMVLHTWGQNLHHHPHVHAVVSGGGLSCNPKGIVDPAPTWKSCRPGFFLPVRVLGRVFRAKYLDGLRRLVAEGRLVLPQRCRDPTAFAEWLAPLQARDWVVYAKRPFGGPEQVLKYLARYTHRVAISNSRLVNVDEHGVTFGYRDHADDHRSKVTMLSGVEFLRRFMQHVLPKGFVKVRHYGLLAPRNRDYRLAVCRRLLVVESVRARRADAAPPEQSVAAPVTPVDAVTAAAEPCCPHCGSRRLVRRDLPPPESSGPPRADTS
jgi:Putative transposase/Transposase zinc-binding domain